MPCLVGCLALSMPRLALILVWLFSPGWLGAAYQTRIWPVLGFLFMPLTTLAYAYAWHLGAGHISGGGLVLLIVAVLVDLGLFGSGERARRSRKASPVVIKGERVG